ncbi:MAG TPA: TIM44-like domain-containing protein [Candidatus Dormibacteraeota bacterium]|jgi:predicted lipid-binding transport protein (Tim44 family)|nr:TIM44-like domain-containing protein [Candidatus Dormibacteraeota bacterium]
MSLRAAEPSLPFVDPTFDQEAFLEQTRATFYTVKRAWAELRPEISRHVMAEDLWQTQKAQIEVLRLDGCRSVLDGISVIDAHLGEALTIGTDDRVEVVLDVAGHDYVVRESTGAVVRGDPEESSWSETWTMQRSRDPRLLEQSRAAKCPECGSPLNLDADGACEFCHAVVPGAKVDWLVVDVARTVAGASSASGDPDVETARRSVIAAIAGDAAASPWTGHVPGPLPVSDAAQAGIAAIQAGDPGFSAGDFLARAREVFVRIDESRNELATSVIRPLVSDAFYAGELARENSVRDSGRNPVEAFLDVESVALVTAEREGGRDRIVARVTASSAHHVIDIKAGVLAGGDDTVTSWTTDLTFERQPTVTSDATRGTGAPVCAGCGELGTVGDDGVCAACGRHVTGGEFDWVLVAEARPGA